MGVLRCVSWFTSIHSMPLPFLSVVVRIKMFLWCEPRGRVLSALTRVLFSNDVSGRSCLIGHKQHLLTTRRAVANRDVGYRLASYCVATWSTEPFLRPPLTRSGHATCGLRLPGCLLAFSSLRWPGALHGTLIMVRGVLVDYLFIILNV